MQKRKPKIKTKEFFWTTVTHTHTHMFRVFQQQHVWYRTAITTYQQAKRDMREASSKHERKTRTRTEPSGLDDTDTHMHQYLETFNGNVYRYTEQLL
jgi:hypothetical protein